MRLNDSRFNLVAPLAKYFAYLSMLFIHAASVGSSLINSILKYATLGEKTIRWDRGLKVLRFCWHHQFFHLKSNPKTNIITLG